MAAVSLSALPGTPRPTRPTPPSFTQAPRAVATPAPPVPPSAYDYDPGDEYDPSKPDPVAVALLLLVPSIAFWCGLGWVVYHALTSPPH